MLLSKKSKISLLTILVIAIVGFLAYRLIDNDRYDVLSQDEINKYTQKKLDSTMSLLSTENITSKSNPHAIMLYKRNNRIGTYTIIKNNNSIEGQKGMEVPIDKQLPIQVTGALSGTPFLGIYITNQKLIKEGNIIEMEFDDNSKIHQTMKSNKKGYILSKKVVPENTKDSVQVSIIDHNNNVLYTEEY
ncbi:hypothetical protein [Priestia megaterium]|uniref:hypothetical protein n=1 Tax=Priestia megaterium TaxID=1404 RepID=UPI0039FD873A